MLLAGIVEVKLKVVVYFAPRIAPVSRKVTDWVQDSLKHDEVRVHGAGRNRRVAESTRGGGGGGGGGARGGMWGIHGKSK